ncbi:phosphoribosylglycinamide formyltransferase [uncultured Eubacterium sp.]|uniref:phosphoribosylglycinamide formyltransferase n=2 Tax=Eubacterium TaxID=1730 RepID=UPI0025F0152A|nr:phosphoribosylglycinamide formyltransferase [uncultured Eubacterium sp.]
MLNIAVFVSGGGTNLQALIDAQDRGEIKNGKITFVLASNENAYALERAKKAGIDTAVVSRKQYESKADYDKAVLKTLDGRDIDLIVLAGFLSILGEDLVSKYNNRIINVHPSLIPLFCGDGFYGKKVHKAVLDSGMKVTGATVHFVNEITDGGAIILQKAVPIEQGDNEDILQYRVMRQAEWEILPKAVSLFCEGRIKINGNKTEIIRGAV